MNREHICGIKISWGRHLEQIESKNLLRREGSHEKKMDKQGSTETTPPSNAGDVLSSRCLWRASAAWALTGPQAQALAHFTALLHPPQALSVLIWKMRRATAASP